MAQPLTQPIWGPSARVVHANVVPQSGSARLRWRYAAAMRTIGTKAAIITPGEKTPIPFTAATNPSVAASEYAGATDAVPTTRLDTNPIALAFRPLSAIASLRVIETTSVALALMALIRFPFPARRRGGG